MSLCGYCGATLAKTGAPLPPSKGPEEKIWSGRYSMRAVGHWWLLYGLWLALLAYICFHQDVQKEIQKHDWMVYLAAALASMPLLYILSRVLYRKVSLSYRLTNQRLFKTRGILFRQIDEIELIRVDDLQVRQSLFNRIFNVGTIIVVAPSDRTEPELHLLGVVNPIEVKERIREHVQRLKQRSIRMEQI
jgi:uncharacterized membrane protein YdbT with pleckstrin-like domain